MILIFILFIFIVCEILQPSSGHVQGKGILIAEMAPAMITHAASGWIFREWNENKISHQYILLK